MSIRHPWRAMLCGLIAALTLTWLGVPPAPGLALGFGLGVLIVALSRDPAERHLGPRRTEEWLLFYDD